MSDAFVAQFLPRKFPNSNEIQTISCLSKVDPTNCQKEDVKGPADCALAKVVCPAEEPKADRFDTLTNGQSDF